MSIVFTITESSGGLWCISRKSTALHTELRFAEAIKLARQMARDEHAITGLPTTVEMITPELTTILAQYARPDETPQAAVA